MDVILLGEISSLIDGVNTKVQAVDTVVRGISTDIGATNATGGTTTAGTVMAKLNAIIGNTATNNTASTSGTLSQKISSAISNTAATTTENSSGTLSAKLTYLINRRDKVVTPSSTNIKTLASDVSIVTAKNSNQQDQSATSTTYSCYVKHDGTYRIYVTGTATLTEAGYKPTNVKEYDGQPTWTMYAACSSTSQKTNSVTGSYGTNVSSTTKTIDLYCVRGDYLTVSITCKTKVGGHPCVGQYGCGKWTYTFSDISVRGTANEVNTVTT